MGHGWAILYFADWAPVWHTHYHKPEERLLGPEKSTDNGVYCSTHTTFCLPVPQLPLPLFPLLYSSLLTSLIVHEASTVLRVSWLRLLSHIGPNQLTNFKSEIGTRERATGYEEGQLCGHALSRLAQRPCAAALFKLVKNSWTQVGPLPKGTQQRVAA